RIGPEQGDQNADRGRLAGTVGTEQPEDVAPMHLEADAGEGPYGAEVAYQPLALDGEWAIGRATGRHGDPRREFQAGSRADRAPAADRHQWRSRMLGARESSSHGRRERRRYRGGCGC